MFDTVIDDQVFNFPAMFELLGQDEMGELLNQNKYCFS